MSFVLGFFGGVVLGGIFFGGLHWTVRRMVLAQQPLFLALVSFLVRLTLAGVGFFLLLLQGLGSLAAGVLGFFLARFLLIRRYGLPEGTGAESRERFTRRYEQAPGKG